MVATIVDGKGLAGAILVNIKTQADALTEPLHLAAVCVGEDPGLRAFVKLKQKAAQSAGITFSSYLFDGKDTQEVLDTLKYLAVDDTVQGIFIELPLPAGWDADELIARIPPSKDVDALTRMPTVPEPAVRALQYVLAEYDITPHGMAVAVVGHGRLVGRPIARWLGGQGADVRIIDIDTPGPAAVARQCGMLITGVGTAGLVTGEWVKDGAVVIDFGYADGKGDVDAEPVKRKAGLLTPVPGGMGPLVIAAVLENLLTLALDPSKG